MTLYGHFLLCAFVSVDVTYNKIIIQRSVHYTNLHNINNWSKYYKTIPQNWYTASCMYSDWSSSSTCKWILHMDIMAVYDDLL